MDMKVVIPKGATSRILTVYIQASADGSGLGSLTHESSIAGGYVREGSTGVALAVDEDVTTEGTYQAPSAAGKVRIGTPANMPTGTYELHFHNDLWATGAETVTIGLGGAAGMADLLIEVQLSDPVRGLGSPTALPNAAADAAGGLPISDAGGLDLDAMAATIAASDDMLVSGSVDDESATTTSFVGDSGLSATNDFYNGCVLAFTSGTLKGLARKITDYVGASKTITLGTALPAAPANAVTFIIIGRLE